MKSVMTGDSEAIIQWLFTQDRTKKFDIKEHKEKRSKSQNSYAWELIGKIASELRKSKEEVYLEMLKSYGKREVVSMLSNINPNGYFKYFEEMGKGIVNNKEFTHYYIFKGSSEFNTKEMSVFIDGIVQEAEQLDIPTLTPSEIASMNLF